jgi:hypothetical protein
MDNEWIVHNSLTGIGLLRIRCWKSRYLTQPGKKVVAMNRQAQVVRQEAVKAIERHTLSSARATAIIGSINIHSSTRNQKIGWPMFEKLGRTKQLPTSLTSTRLTYPLGNERMRAS